MNVLIIVNPQAGAGKARQTLQALQQALTRSSVSWEMANTSAPGQAARQLRRLAPGSVDGVVVIGGDGTINDVCQGYLDAQGRALPGPPLCVVPAGTGGDFRRTFGFEATAQSAVERLLAGNLRGVDLGVAEVGGQQLAFANILSFGLSGEVCELVNRGSKRLGGRATFFLASLRSSLVFDNPAVSIHLDGEPWFKGRSVTVAIANGQYFGGGMRIAPDADPSDGLLDVVVLKDMSTSQLLMRSNHWYRGTHVEFPWVKVGRARSVRAEGLETAMPVRVEMDGETPGALPLNARVLPNALQLYA